jgi:hypothetical protein
MHCPHLSTAWPCSSSSSRNSSLYLSKGATTTHSLDHQSGALSAHTILLLYLGLKGGALSFSPAFSNTSAGNTPCHAMQEARKSLAGQAATAKAGCTFLQSLFFQSACSVVALPRYSTKVLPVFMAPTRVFRQPSTTSCRFLPPFANGIHRFVTS